MSAQTIIGRALSARLSELQAQSASFIRAGESLPAELSAELRELTTIISRISAGELVIIRSDDFLKKIKKIKKTLDK